MGRFPRKRLLIRSKIDLEHNESTESILASTLTRLGTIKNEMKKTDIDAPDFQRAVYLGKIHSSDNFIYRVCVSGYIFRYEPILGTAESDLINASVQDDTKVNDEHGNARYTVFASYDPKYLLDNSEEAKQNRQIYVTAWDGHQYSQGSPMISVSPGDSTYIHISRDAYEGLRPSEKAKELYFVPCFAARFLNIHPDDCIIKVGSVTEPLDQVDYLDSYVNNPVISKTWAGNWCGNNADGHMKHFAAVNGYMRIRRNDILFTDDSLYTAFMNSHPVSQLVNDQPDTDVKYGFLMIGYNCKTALDVTDKNADTGKLEDHCKTRFTSKPWNNLRSSQKTVQTTAPHLRGVQTNMATGFTTPDQLKWSNSLNASINIYALIYLQKDVNYSFALKYDDAATVCINGTQVVTNASSASGSTSTNISMSDASVGTYTPTETGWHEIAIGCVDTYTSTTSNQVGGNLLISTTNRKAVTGQDEWNNLQFESNAENAKLGLLLRIPDQVSSTEYAQWNNYTKKIPNSQGFLQIGFQYYYNSQWDGDYNASFQRWVSVKFIDKPWQAFGPDRIVITPKVPHINNAAYKGYYIGDVPFYAGSFYSIMNYTKMWMDAGVTYRFSAVYDDFIAMGIDGVCILSQGYAMTTYGAYEYTPTSTGWHEMTIFTSDFSKGPFGGYLIVSTTNRAAVLGGNAKDWTNEYLIEDPDKGLMFRIPDEITYKEWTQWERYSAFS